MITLESLNNFLLELNRNTFFEIKVSDLLYSIIVFLFFLIAKNSLIIFFSKKFFILFKLNKKNEEFTKNIYGPLNLLVIGLAIFLASTFLTENDKITEFIYKINISVFTIVTFWLLSQIIKPLFSKVKTIEQILTQDLIEWITNFLKILVFILGFCAVLELWGIRVGPIIAGLGLLGVAVALGAQDLFKNLISGVLVLIEKRFRKGDVIIIENTIEGTVEKIGFRSTAIRRFDKSLCFIPNNQFAEKAVTNITKISNRRINWIIGLEYKSTTKQLKTICNDIENKIISRKENFSVNETTPVIVKIYEFSDSSINILVRCFTKTNDFNQLLEAKNELAIDIKEIVEKRGGAFAFPSQSIYVEKN
ncbi:MAG: mechanosensitive ion channel family protein [Pelagibacteraceae bacterium TMED124]|nr:mechanosensitive ion channel protein MscS [Rickettsiales bacterium]RPG18404.1 MAG: mechanosensitive ion channel family protein [Pelagibacteraceae bacterium TMED124]